MSHVSVTEDAGLDWRIIYRILKINKINSYTLEIDVTIAHIKSSMSVNTSQLNPHKQISVTASCP
jgi:hypothetical protein